MSTIYITHDLGKVNYLPAEKYGELKSVIEGHVSPLAVKRSFARMQDEMRGITKDDWIIPSGNPALMALAGFIMANRTGMIRMLVWDGQTSQYVPSEVRVL